jgi:hypothetical protein
VKPKQKKVKSRRDKAKHPNLQARYSPRIRSEYIDYDYLDKLDEEALAYLNKFTGEFHGASFAHDETDIQSYQKYGKDCNDRNNSANRDTYGKLRSRTNNFKAKLVGYDNMLSDIENKLSSEINPANMENAYVDFIESKQLQAMIEEYDQAMLNFSETDEKI